MLRITALILFVLTIVPAVAAQESKPTTPSATTVTVPTFANTTCPIMGKPSSTKLFADTPHGRIYICCKACVKKIDADPESAYKAAYPTAKKVGNKVCPVTGEPVDPKSTVTIQGYEIGLCCSECAKGVLDNAQVYLAKLTNPKVVDVDNATCPITGKPVANNAFVLIGDNLVHLSSPDCVETVTKDPKKALDKANEIKSAEKKAGGEKKPEPHHGGGGGSASGR